MGRKETIMYCFRLNINNPDHLALHKILRDIDDKEHTIIVVGDPKQSIYQFQGADARLKCQPDGKIPYQCRY